MSTKKSFKSFFEEDLRPRIYPLEHERNVYADIDQTYTKRIWLLVAIVSGLIMSYCISTDAGFIGGIFISLILFSITYLDHRRLFSEKSFTKSRFRNVC